MVNPLRAKIKRGKLLRGKNPMRIDPSRTTTLRRAFTADVNRRFNKLRLAVVDLVDKQDAFGLRRKDLTANSFDPDQPRAEDGKWTSGGGGQVAPPRVSGAGTRRLIDHAKAIGHTIGHAEHVVKTVVSDRIASTVAKLPLGLQKQVLRSFAVGRFGTSVAFATWKAGQAVAERVAIERGATPEEARRLRGVLSGLDMTTFKPISLGLHATGLHAGTLGAISLLPPASISYLAYSTARNPIKTLRGAVGAIKSIASRRKETPAHNALAVPLHDLVTALESHGYADWYIALLSAALDTAESLQEAISLANEAFDDTREEPTTNANPYHDALGRFAAGVGEAAAASPTGKFGNKTFINHVHKEYSARQQAQGKLAPTLEMFKNHLDKARQAGLVSLARADLPHIHNPKDVEESHTQLSHDKLSSAHFIVHNVEEPTLNPFVSEAQRAWMYANKPEMAKEWEEHTPEGKKLPKKVTKNHWVTKEDGQHIFINDDGSVSPSGPAIHPHEATARASAVKTAKLFGLPDPKINLVRDSSGKSYGEHGSDTVHIVNAHEGRLINKQLSFKPDRDITEGEHIAAHEVSHAAYSADSEAGRHAMDRLKQVKAQYGSSVSMYGALSGPFENLMELGAVYSHSPKSLKAYSPEMYHIAEEWANKVKQTQSREKKITANTRWADMNDPEKLEAFQEWLEQQFMGYLANANEEELWNKFIMEGYKKGAGRAFDDTNKSRRWKPGEGKFYEGSKEQFLRSSFAQPEAVAKVKLLASRAFDELENVTSDMSNKMSRVLAQGLVQGQNPHDIAKSLAEEVDISKNRAAVIARTEIIRAHAEGQLSAFKSLGVEELGVAVEWSTAGDDRVCEDCEPLEGIVLKLSEAQGMIPRHPNCRCTWIPANVGEDEEDQKRSKGEINSAIKESLKASDDDWGPGATISRSRPESIL